MPELLRMPEVSAGATSATLCEWLVGENQHYVASAVLATIETDKAVVDFTADEDGVLLRILVSPGTETEVGAPIALVASLEEKVDDVDAALAALTGSVTSPLLSVSQDASPGLPPEPAAQAAPDATAGDVPPTPGLHGDPVPRIFVSPLARRLAAQAGLALESITPTGPSGRIIRHDVEVAIARQSLGGPPVRPMSYGPNGQAPSPPPPQLPTSAVRSQKDLGEVTSPAGYGTEIPHSRVRRAIAQRLIASKQTIPHFYVRGSAQVDRLVELRARLNESSDLKLSVNDFVMKAVAHAHQSVPAMNVLWTDDFTVQMPTVDLGAAVATPSGLVTPVLRCVEQMPIRVLSAMTRDLAERAREGRLHQHELEGGSSTVTNLGMYGVEEFAAIINPPQSSIVAVGSVQKEPVVTKKGNIRIRSVLRVTVSVDHRCIDGVIAVQWMRAFLAVLEEPIRLLV